MSTLGGTHNLFPEEEENGMSEILFVVKQRDALKSLIDKVVRSNKEVSIEWIKKETDDIMSGHSFQSLFQSKSEQEKIDWVNTRG